MTIDRDKIMNRKQFYKLGRADQRALMAHWRIAYSTEQIKKEMNLSTTAFYSLLKRLDLPTNLKAYRDASPSLLDGTIKNKIKQIEDFKCQIELIGNIDLDELTNVLQFAKEHNLDINLKTE